MSDGPEATSWSDWPPLLILTLVGLLLVGVGALLGAYYCEYRRVSEVQQLSQVTKQAMIFATECMATLKPTVGAAIVFARNDRPRPLPPIVRDSLREARWVKP